MAVYVYGAAGGERGGEGRRRGGARRHARGAPREEHLRIDILRHHLRQQLDGIPATIRGVSRGEQRQRARIATPIIELEAVVGEHQRHHIATME